MAIQRLLFQRRIGCVCKNEIEVAWLGCFAPYGLPCAMRLALAKTGGGAERPPAIALSCADGRDSRTHTKTSKGSCKTGREIKKIIDIAEQCRYNQGQVQSKGWYEIFTFKGLLLERKVVFRLEGGESLAVYEALMLTFGIFILELITLIVVIVEIVKK